MRVFSKFSADEHGVRCWQGRWISPPTHPGLFPGRYQGKQNHNRAYGNRKLQLRDATSVEVSGGLKDMEGQKCSPGVSAVFVAGCFPEVRMSYIMKEKLFIKASEARIHKEEILHTLPSILQAISQISSHLCVLTTEEPMFLASTTGNIFQNIFFHVHYWFSNNRVIKWINTLALKCWFPFNSGSSQEGGVCYIHLLWITQKQVVRGRGNFLYWC